MSARRAASLRAGSGADAGRDPWVADGTVSGGRRGWSQPASRRRVRRRADRRLAHRGGDGGFRAGPARLGGFRRLGDLALIRSSRAPRPRRSIIERWRGSAAGRRGAGLRPSQGILHRDIKPSNLLLDAKGTVWVTDFGLAKAEGTDALTHTGDIVGTLRYMAPERFDGWSDPRSDVYALGATLYELLTLRQLFEEANRAKLIDRVLHDDPASPRKLDRKVPRDLETIVLKAIAKEPAQRYATAEQMAEDLRRFLADKPMLARRSSPMEQAWRWCRRNKGLAAGIAVAIVGLVAAVVVLAITNVRIARTSRALAAAVDEKDGALTAARKSEALAKTSAAERDRQRVRAEAGEAQARAAVDQFLDPRHRGRAPEGPRPPAAAPRPAPLGAAVLRRVPQAARRRPGPPRRAGGRAAPRRQDPAGPRRWRRRANKSFLAAREIYQALTGEKPDDRDVQAGLADCQFRLGAIPEAIAIYEKLIKLDPTNPRYRRELAEAYNSQATNQNDRDQGRGGPGRRTARRWPSARAWSASSPTIPRPGTTWAGRSTTSASCSTRQGHQQDALAMYRRAVEQTEAAFARAPQVILYGRYLGTQYSNVASTLRALGRHDEAISAYQRSVEHWRRMTRENPEVPVFRANLHSEANDFGALPPGPGPEGRGGRARSAWRPRAMEDQPRKSGGDLYNLACARALAAAAIGAAPGGPTAEDRRERDRLDRRRDGCPPPVDRDGLRDGRAHAGRRGPGDPPRPRRLPGPGRPQAGGRRGRGPGQARANRARPRRGSRPGRRPWRRGPSSSRKIRGAAATAPTWRPASTPSARSSPTSAGSTRPRRP